MQTRLWCYVQRGQSVGPVPEEQLRALLASGDLYWDDLVWREGMADWLPARQVTELVGAPPSPTPVPAKPSPFMIPAPVPIQLDSRPEPMQMARAANTSREVSPQAVEWLRRTKPWVRFLAVLGLLATVLTVAAIVVMSLAADAMPGAARGIARTIPLVMGVVMLAIQLPPILLLNRYASRIGNLLRTNDPQDLDEALRAQKSFWKYLGILTLVVLVLYILGIIAALGMGLAMGGLRRF